MSDAITLLFSGIVAVSTVVYAVLTWQLVTETRKMRKAQTEPKVSIWIQPTDRSIRHFDMFIENIGLGPAYHIKLSLTPDLKFERGYCLSKIGIFQNGIPYLSPRSQIRFYIPVSWENFDQIADINYQIDVEYHDSTENKYSENIPIDFSQYNMMMGVGKPPIYSIARSIDEINKNIRRIGAGFQRIEVVSYTKEEVEQEIEAIREQETEALKVQNE